MFRPSLSASRRPLRKGPGPPLDIRRYVVYSRLIDETRTVQALGALAQETRLRTFRLLMEHAPGGLPAGEVARRLGAPHNTMSSHLAILSRAGLVTSRRESRQVIYAVDTAGIRGLIAFLVEQCCGGRPDACAPLLDAALPLAGQTCPSEIRP